MNGSNQYPFSPLWGCNRLFKATFALLFATTLSAFAQTVTPSKTILAFTPAQVGIAPSSAESLTETFTLSGYSSLITPTAKMNYGLAYKAGAIGCTGSAGNQTCTVSVSFVPNYPGGRRDALFLMNGTTRLATVLAFGIGQSPFALIQPGVITNPVLNSTNYQYTSVTGEDGTLYQLEDEGNAVEAVTSAGVVTTLPITGLNSPRGIGIDGAGILYIVDQTFSGHFTTYDTVQHLQGSLPFPDSAYFQTLAVGNEGTLYAFGSSGNGVWTIPPTGTPTLTVLNPTFSQPSVMTVDDNENVFIGGYAINKITSGGVQTQINAVGAGDGISTDAADTVYATRYSGYGGVALLPATGYGTPETTVDSGVGPLGASVGPDGTVYVGNYSNIDKVDRSRGVISFGEQQANVAATTQSVQIYNGGNTPLTLSSLAISGDGFTITASSTANCTAAGTIAPGALCNLSVGFLPTHAGLYSGTITITSNSLNNSATTQTVALSGFVYGVYVQASPSPLAFVSQTINTTSSPLTVTFTNNGDLYSAGVGSFSSTDPAFVLTVSPAGCYNVGVGQTCTAGVTFEPTLAQAYSATISYMASSSGGGANTNGSFTVTGTGTPAAAQVTASPTSLNFGSVTENTESTPQKITITNSSTSTVVFGTLAFSSQFVLYQDDCGSQLAANSSCYYLVAFQPNAVGGATGTLSIPYTGPSGSPLVVNLSGTGTAGTAVLNLYPSTLNFGILPVGTAASAATIQVSNGGTAPFGGLAIAITGPGASDYTQTNTCAGVTLAANYGNQCLVTIGFTPSANGPRGATLSVTGGAANSPQTVALSGAGVATLRQIQFTPTQLNLLAGAGGACGDTTTGGTAKSATLCNVQGAVQDYLGNTYAVDKQYNVVYKIDTSGTISVFAGTPSTTSGYTGDGGPATSATLSGPTAVAADAFGDIFISDTANSAIREVDPTGTITSFVDSTCDEGGRGAPMHRFTPLAGRPHPHETQLCEVFKPEGLVADSFGNLIFADALNNVVLEVGIVSGNFTFVAGDAESLQGTAGYNGDNIPADGAELNAPQDVAVDTAGNIYIADTLNNRVRMVTASTGTITTVAGNGTQGDTGDGAPATSAEIKAYGVSTDLAGDLFITTGTGGIVRKVDSTGNISLFAGGGSGSIGGLASTAAVTNAYFARVDNAGDLIIPDGLQLLSAGPDGILQFGSEPVGSTTAPLTITVEDTGDGSFALTDNGQINATGDFYVTGGTCISGDGDFTAGQTCTLTVTFAPTASGARTGTISVPSNVPGSPATILLQGNGTAASTPAASLSPGTLSFGTINVGSTATAQTLTLSNTGTAILNISAITIAGTNPIDFAETTTCGAMLAAGANCTISVTFTPASAASFAATILVADDASGSPQTATLTGAGVVPAAPVATLTPGTLTFLGTVVGATTTAQTLTLSNTGNAVLNINGVTLTGTNPSDFADTTTCGATLAAGANCTISVTFTPASVATFTATVSVADNAAGSPHTATLSGAGIAAPDFSVSASPPAQTVTGGTGATFTVTVAALNGDFSDPVNLTASGVPAGATATFTPASITPGGETTSSVLTIQTTTALAQMHPPARWPWVPAITMALCVPLLLWRKRSRQRLLSTGLLMLLFSGGAAMLSGCGGGYYAQPPSQTYTITVTGTSGSTQHATTVTLTVQ